MKVQLLTEPMRALVLRINRMAPFELAFGCPKKSPTLELPSIHPLARSSCNKDVRGMQE